MTAGPEEPNALVQVERADGVSEPMVRATTLQLEAGLRAWPLAGKGRLIDRSDDARFDKRYAHVEVLVIGAGASGLAAAAAARAADPDARVLVLDADPAASGDGVLADTTALGVYDHGYVTAVERHPTARTEGRLWHIRAGRIVVATGATERPIVFADDDRPGIMLASAAAAYVERYGVRPGARAVVFTNNDTTDRVAARAPRGRGRDRCGGRRPARRDGGRHRSGRRGPAGVRRDRPRRWALRDRRRGPAARLGRLEPERRAVEPGPRHAPLRRADRRLRPGSARPARAHGRRSARPPATSRTSDGSSRPGSSRRPATNRARTPGPRTTSTSSATRPPATCAARSVPA